jgi:hypothetical protein
MEPYKDAIDSEDITYSEFIDRVMNDLADEVGGKAKAEKLIDLAIALENEQ